MTRRVGLPGYRWIPLLAFVAAVSLWGWPGEAHARATAFEITGFNLFTNLIEVEFSTSRENNCNVSSGEGANSASRSVYLKSGFSNPALQVIGVYHFPTDTLENGDCPALTDKVSWTSAYNLGSGGDKTLWLSQSYSGSRSDTYTFPSKVRITSASVSGDVLSLSWTSPTTDSTADYHYLITRSGQNTVLQSGLLAENTASTRSADVTLASSLLENDPQQTTAGAFDVIVFVDDDQENSQNYSSRATRTYYLASSTRTAFSYGDLPQCQDSDLTALDYLYGYGSNLEGSISDSPCSVDADETGYGDVTTVAANIYSFRLGSQRSTTFVFTPLVDFEDAGIYKVRLKRASLSGDLMAEATGTGTVEIENISIGAGLVYTLEVFRVGTGGGQDWSLSLSYGFIDPPTPTPLPTPTPRVQPNQDFRLHPNPSGLTYEVDTEYTFEFEGGSFLFPVSVRSANPAALELSLSGTIACDVSNPDELTVTDPAQVLHIRTCTAGKNTSLSVVSEGGGDLLADYNIYVRGGPVPTPMPAAPVPGAGAHVSKRDVLGLGILIAIPCGGLGIGCDIDLITILLVTVAAVGVMALLLKRSRGAATSMSVGVATVFAIAVLMLGYLWLGFPLWIVGAALTAILAMGGLAMVVKGKQVG